LPRLVAAGVPPALDGVDVVERLLRVGPEADRVEDVELGLGRHEGGVGHPGGRDVLLGLARDVARVAAVGLARDRVVHEEVDVERLVLAERVEHRGRRVGEQGHVGLVDRLEAPDGRAVERDAVLQDVGGRGGRYGQVLHHAGKVAEADVEILDLLVRDELENLFGVVEHPRLLLRSARGSSDAMVGMLPVGHSAVSQRLTASRPVATLLSNLDCKPCPVGLILGCPVLR